MPVQFSREAARMRETPTAALQKGSIAGMEELGFERSGYCHPAWVTVWSKGAAARILSTLSRSVRREYGFARK